MLVTYAINDTKHSAYESVPYLYQEFELQSEKVNGMAYYISNDKEFVINHVNCNEEDYWSMTHGNNL